MPKNTWMAIKNPCVPHVLAWACALAWLAALTACGVSYPYSGKLMPTPLYRRSDQETNASSQDAGPIEFKILYATDREPANATEDEPNYLNERGQVVRLGVCPVRMADSRPNATIQVGDVEEMGVLPDSTNWLLREEYADNTADRFWSLVNERLKRAGAKEITVYVPGFKVVFENPVMVAAELWHSMGGKGIVMAYSWPAKPTIWAYLGDIESTRIAAWSLRHLLIALAENTIAESINIVGYSAGTRVVLGALRDLRLMNHGKPREDILARTRIKNVLLIGSDVDREVFGVYYSDGLIDTIGTLTVYVSKTDSALAFSEFLFNRDRLGDSTREYTEEVWEYLGANNHLVAIDVTDAEDSQTGNGHGYFRNSPWVSNDILLLLGKNLPPAERGLIQNPDTNVWEFPPDYPETIRSLRSRLNAPTSD